MPSAVKIIETSIPDLRDIPLERLAEIGDSALGHSISLYLARISSDDATFSSFQAVISSSKP